MRRVLRWAGYALAGLVGVVLLGGAAVYGKAEYHVRRRHTPAARHVDLPLLSDSLSIIEGERLAGTRGCLGCHGKALEGRVMIDNFLLATVVAPNLTQSTRRYSDEELERIIRYGVRPDGRSVVVMPSSMYHALSDEDLARILAFIRSLPLAEGHSARVSLGPLARLMFAVGRFTTEADRLAADSSVPPTVRPHLSAREDTLALGWYLARTSCTECHGLDLTGRDGGAPHLAIARTYSLDQFGSFFQTGKTRDGRETEMMSSVARNRFSNFTPAEVAALHTYLQTLPIPGVPATD